MLADACALANELRKDMGTKPVESPNQASLSAAAHRRREEHTNDQRQGAAQEYADNVAEAPKSTHVSNVAGWCRVGWGHGWIGRG